MTLANEMLLEGFRVLLSVQGQRLKYKEDKLFMGIIQPAQSLDPRMELGTDLRELSTLESIASETPAIGQGDLIFGTTTPGTWKVIRREDNPADFKIRYWIVKVTTQDK